jgi:hypothetical protein
VKRNITAAWAALDATPKYPRSWSAWARDRSRLFITLPERDVLSDGCTIPLWDCSWTNALGQRTATNDEQEINLRNAIAGKKPILGFRVEMSGESIKAAYHERLLPVTIVEQTSWKIMGKVAERLVPP